MKYLGVVLDDKLAFDDHINQVHTKASKKLGILRRARDYLDTGTSLLLYKSLVLPHLDYCELVYMCTTIQNLNKLQLIQNGACRTILRVLTDTSIEQMHKTLEIPTLEQRRDCHLPTECYKSINSPDSGLNYMFKLLSNTRQRSTRLTTACGMLVPDVRTTQERKRFALRGPTYWNKLDNSIEESESILTFKSNMMKKIMHDVNYPD